jgi:hypothetical protein
MKYLMILFSIICFSILSCNCKNGQLIGTWQPVKLINSNMERQIKQAKIDIDTFGLNDLELAKVVNLDSFKKTRKDLLEMDLKEQEAAIKALRYTFLKDKTVNIKTAEGASIAKWSFTDEGQLLIDERELSGIGDPLYYNILNLNNTELVLQNITFGDTSEMTFKKL